MRQLSAFLFLSLGALAACGPVSPELAARECEEGARAATGPSAEIGLGVSSRGDTRASVEIGVTSDYLQGRDPYQVYEDCVRQKTGQGPIRPLVL